MPRIDALICNAAIAQVPTQKLTVDGFESQLGTNHYGHFVLCGMLFDRIEESKGRIVVVASLGYKMGLRTIQFDDMNWDKNYSANPAYSQSKLANVMYGLELARRLDAAGSKVTSISCHPGYSATNLQSTGPTGVFKIVYKISNALAAQKASDGAIPEVLAAAGNEAVNGAYYGPTKLGETRGPVGDCRISDAAQDVEAGARLWSLSEELLDMTWDVSTPRST